MFTPSSSAAGSAGGRPSSASSTSPGGGGLYPSAVALPSSSSHNSIFSLSSHSRQPSHGDLHHSSNSPLSLQKMHTIQHILNEPEQHVSQQPTTDTHRHTHTHTHSFTLQSSTPPSITHPSPHSSALWLPHLRPRSSDHCDCQLSVASLSLLLRAVCAVLCWLPQYPCTADDYDILQEIGVGAFATVYRALVNATGVRRTDRQTDGRASDTSNARTAVAHSTLRCSARCCAAVPCSLQEEVAIKIIDLEQFNTNWDEIRVSCRTRPEHALSPPASPASRSSR